MDAKINNLQPLDEITINDDDLLNLVGGYVNILTEDGTQEVLIASAHQDDYDHLIKYLKNQVCSILPTCTHPVAFDLFTADKLAILGIKIGYTKVLRKKWENLPNNDLTAVRVKVHNDLKLYFLKVIKVAADISIEQHTGRYTIDAIKLFEAKSLDDIHKGPELHIKYSNDPTGGVISVTIRTALDLRDAKLWDYKARISEDTMRAIRSAATKVVVSLAQAFNLKT